MAALAPKTDKPKPPRGRVEHEGPSVLVLIVPAIALAPLIWGLLKMIGWLD